MTIEVLEGHRPVQQLPITGLVDDVLGLSAYTDIDALHRMLREGDVLSGAALLIDTARRARLSSRLKRLPAVAGAGFKSAVIRNFRETLTANMNLSIFLNVVFAGIIAFGVVYNAARVSLSERSRELASLRVLGFTRAEISLILLGELALLTMAALPVGGLLGYGHGGRHRAGAGQRGVSLPARHLARRRRVGVSDHHRRHAHLRADRQAAARSARSRGRAEDSGVDHRMRRLLTNWRILATLVVVSIILGVALWPEAVEVDIARAERGPLQVTIDEEGETRVRERFVVSAPVAGRLQRIELEPGDPVVRGQDGARAPRRPRSRRCSTRGRRRN